MNIKLVVSDIDGVWTDGGMYYDNRGNELKKFNTSDSAGILFLREMGIKTAIITGEDTEIVRRRAEKLKVDFLYMGVRNKLKIARKICDDQDISLDKHVAYIGDDIIDIPLLQKVALSAAPIDAPDYVKEHVIEIMTRKGGEGVFREFVEKLLESQGLLEEAIYKYLDKIKDF